MLDWFGRLFGRPRQDAAALQAAFEAQFRHFRALLTANNNALELMATAEERLESGRPFGMAFVRGEMTALTVNVYKMVQALHALTEGGYQALDRRLAEISARIEAILARQPQVAQAPWVLPLARITREDIDRVGAKMAHLGELRNRLGLKVPDGFAITAWAAKQFLDYSDLQTEIARRLQSLDIDDLESLYAISAAIQDLIRAAPLPEALEAAIAAAVADLASRTGRTDLVLALRSSALGEDSRHDSFAGLYRTRLRVTPAEVVQAYRDVVASKYQSRAIVYRQQRGYRHQDVLMAVGCQEMVEAVASGVLFTRPPDSLDGGELVIHAARGLGEQIVDGLADYDRYRVQRENPHAVHIDRLAEPMRGPCLDNAQIVALTRIGLRVEAHFGLAQDIEWALDAQGELYLLQARPLERVADAAAPPTQDPGAPAPLLAGGVTASPGAAAGPVHKVTCPVEAMAFPKGGVLVVENPLPEWAVLIGRAAAVLSETGQAASHLATVAREFRVPALFGLDAAMQRLQEGEIVTVSASTRQVFAGRVEVLLAAAPPPPNLMRGSPVYTLLKEALAHVTPLHLTDPDSPYFKAAHCRTLHDITRFCHEKAVQAMFEFGRRHGVRDKTAKRLVVGDAPTQWWVLDLKDGFAPTVERAAEYICLEDIVSVPMRALWTGMTAIPWAGPPPVSLRGLGAIIAQSAMNPQIEATARSSLGERNYFLVSKKFCNLSVRLGYHFAFVEANLSELLTESYVCFRFQGGAADEHRRRLRVYLLGQVLRELGFRVSIKADALAARIERRPIPYLEERLTLLGYLIIHTRQVDIVMDAADSRERYLAKVHADLDTLRARLAAEEPQHAATAPTAADR